ncbi:MAG: DUF4190 domain-containing protein [Planctomycetes bacterium]|nr:DUF4190 domain-containing protein [Planctomycetota bacterium]
MTQDPADDAGTAADRFGRDAEAPPALPPQSVAPPMVIGYAPATGRESKTMAGAAFMCGSMVILAPLLVPNLLISVFSLLAATVLSIIVLVIRRRGRGLAVAGLVVAWGAVAMWWAVNHAVRTSYVHMFCSQRLLATGAAVTLYRNDNSGAFPPDLTALVAAGHIDARQLHCAATPPGGVDYFYTPRPPLPSGAGTPKGSTTILACDFRNNHRRHRGVVFLDGHIERLKDSDFQALLALPENAAFASALRAAEGP